MEMKNKDILIAISREDGGVSIMSFTVIGRGNVLPSGAIWLKDGWWSRDSSKEIVDSEVAKATAHPSEPKAISWRFIELSEVPQDRTYRNAWKDDGQRIAHDMTKAREIHRDHIRKARKAALAELDGRWMRATGQGDNKRADLTEAERQKWRDAPEDARIEAAQTTEELKALLLEIK